MPKQITIIGAGLAGLALTQSLLDQSIDGGQITLVDAGDAARASDVPGTLMHPFPGRSMRPKRGQLASAKTSVDFLRRLRAEAGDGAVLELPMARPLLGGKKRDMADRLRDSWKASKDDYPDWFDSRIVRGEALAEVDPNLARYDEALVYSPAFSVNTHDVRSHLRAKFRDQGVRLIDDTRVERLERVADKWRVVTSGEGSLSAQTDQTDQVVLALGWGLAEWFPGLPIRGKGGEVLRARPPEGAELRCVINASGHVAPLAGCADAGGAGCGADGGDRTWSAGSTYWRVDQFNERTDALAISELLERCTPLVAALADSEPITIGRGVRASYRGDNRPLVGPVPGLDDLFVFGAFGSKGLLRIPEFADQLAALLLGGPTIDQRASTARVKREKWLQTPRLT
jgi:glycine/D-amino acid oxidase-like deaminating enzyme